MYSKGKIRNKRREDESFAFLVSPEGNTNEDLRLMQRLILYCEEMALNIPPIPISDLAETVDNAFRALEISNRPLTADERAYLQLHLLVCFHNVLFDVPSELLETVAGNDDLTKRCLLLVQWETRWALILLFITWKKTNIWSRRTLEAPAAFDYRFDAIA